MRIGVEASCRRNARGLGRFARELIARLERDFGARHQLLLCDAEEVRSRGWRGPLALGRRLVGAWAARPDVFLFPAVYSWFPLPGIPQVLVCHDAMTGLRPELFFPSARDELLWKLKSGLARRMADRLLAPSAHARAQIARVHGLDPGGITVIGEAPAELFRPLPPAAGAAARARHGVPEGGALFLCVGSLSPHKNLATVLEAFALVRARRPAPCRLLLVGALRDTSALSCLARLRTRIAALGLEDAVRLTGFVPDAELVALYNGATALVLASLDEGFGLPAVEAMACGLPVVASRRGALPEVLGDAGLFFPATSAPALADALLRLLAEPGLGPQLAARGRARVQGLSWAATAERVMRVLEEVGGCAPG